jgi:peroxiredoxin
MAEPLQAGDRVCDFILTATDGKQYASAQARKRGLLLFAFYKKSCPVCQLAMPFLQRFHHQYAGDAFQVWGIAQEDAATAAEFAEQYHAAFPQLCDTELEVTENYDLRSVPSLYLVDAGDAILQSVFAFSTEDYNALSQQIAQHTGRDYKPIVLPEDNAPLYKPG